MQLLCKKLHHVENLLIETVQNVELAIELDLLYFVSLPEPLNNFLIVSQTENIWSKKYLKRFFVKNSKVCVFLGQDTCHSQAHLLLCETKLAKRTWCDCVDLHHRRASVLDAESILLGIFDWAEITFENFGNTIKTRLYSLFLFERNVWLGVDVMLHPLETLVDLFSPVPDTHGPWKNDVVLDSLSPELEH